MPLYAKREVVGSYLVFGVGFFTILNLAIDPTAAQSARISDFVGVAACALLLRNFSRLRFLPLERAAAFFIVFSLATLATYCFAFDQEARLVILVRLVFSIATGIALAQYTISQCNFRWIAAGLWCGSLAGLLVVWSQIQGLPLLMEFMPIDRVDAAVLGMHRYSGIWGHPNAAAQVTMAGAAAVFLAWRHDVGIKLLPIYLYFVIALLNYILMANRSPILVSLAIISIFTLKKGTQASRLIGVISILGVLVLLVTDITLVLGERWTGSFSGMTTIDQMLERANSTFAGFVLSFSYPLGLPSDEIKFILGEMLGVRATHNGFVNSSLVIGPWITIGFLWVLYRAVRSPKLTAFSRPYQLSMASICMMLLFEDALFEPAITTVICLIAAMAHLEKRGLSTEFLPKVTNI